MGFKCLNSFFGNVVPVIMWGNKLVGHMIQLDCRFEVRGTFVVKDVMLGVYAVFLQPVYQGLVDPYPYHFF